MGKSTISMAIFNSYVSHYQRVHTKRFFGELNIYFLLVSGWDIDRFPIHGMRRSPDTTEKWSVSIW